MLKFRKLLALIAVLVVLIGLSLFIALRPKDEELRLLKGFVSETEENNRLDRYELTRAYSYDYEPFWYPGKKEGTQFQPEINGESAILVDIDSGDVLYEKNSSQKMKIASLAKIMTAVVVLEHINISQNVYISERAANVGENSMGLSEGEIYSVEELMYGLILNSGNDAAYALSEAVAENPETFVAWMNKKAQDIGMQDTHFADPSGLDDSAYSTPVDLVKLTRYALKNPLFLQFVSTVEKELSSDTHKYLSLYNQTNLLETYPGVQGVKTGFTEEAGLCLVTYADNGGKKVVGVVLKSGDRKGDMILMLDHGFMTLGVEILHNLL